MKTELTPFRRAPQVKIEGLAVSSIDALRLTAIALPPQVCSLAHLQAGELLEVRNLTTGHCFVAPLRIGRPWLVEVFGYADPDLNRGDALVVVAGDWDRRRVPPAGFCTRCLCAKNHLIEIRDASAPHELNYLPSESVVVPAPSSAFPS